MRTLPMSNTCCRHFIFSVASAMLSDAENRVLDFLSGNPETFFNRKEIARKAVKRREYEEDPNWSQAALPALVERDLIEQNDSGHYRFKKQY
jgi:hypothetical protein